MYEADELRAVHDAIKRDFNTGICSPERLQANLRRFDLILAEMEGDEARPFEVDRDGIHYGGWSEMAPAYRRARFKLIEGDRS